MESSSQFSYSEGGCRSDANELRRYLATRRPNGTETEISPDIANTFCSGQGRPCTRIHPPIVMSGLPLRPVLPRVNTLGKYISMRESRNVRGVVRLILSLVAAMPRWEQAGNNFPEYSQSRIRLWQGLLTWPPRRPKDRSLTRTPAGNLRSGRRRSGKTGWGYPLCGTTVSL